MLNALNIPEFLAVDFYCGAGGTTRGLLDAGGYVIAGIDKDAGCSRTYLHNNGMTRWTATNRRSCRWICSRSAVITPMGSSLRSRESWNG